MPFVIFIYRMLLSFQTFQTSPFTHDVSVAENFLSAPIITISDVLGSLENKRCSIQGQVVEVNTISLLLQITISYTTEVVNFTCDAQFVMIGT